MNKRTKFQNEAHATEMMMFAIEDGHITAWNMTDAGYVRYFDAVARVWRDLIDFDLKRWSYGY